MCSDRSGDPASLGDTSERGEKAMERLIREMVISDVSGSPSEHRSCSRVTTDTGKTWGVQQVSGPQLGVCARKRNTIIVGGHVKGKAVGRSNDVTRDRQSLSV